MWFMSDFFVSAATRSARGHSHVPRRSSRKPICSLSESMRSSCWKEWDSKVVFSDKPSSSDSGKKLLNGANTNCNFCTEREREGHTKEIRILLQKHIFTQPINKNKSVWPTITTAATLSACLTKHLFASNKTVQVWRFKESWFWGLKNLYCLMV